ncbi:MAG: hypothetical protein ACRC0X_03575 [Brevinema sp.]
MPNNKQQIMEIGDFFKSKNIQKVDIAVVLDSNLSSMINSFSDKTIIPYKEVPHISDSGNFVYVEHHGKNILFLQNHLNTGQDTFETAFSIAGILKARVVLLTNTARSLNSELKAGDIMLISNYINTQNNSPLMSVERNGEIQNTYDVSLLPHLSRGFGVKVGVYGSRSDSQLETIGADAIGIETILVRFHKIRVLGFSMITDQVSNHEEAVQTAGDMLISIIGHLLVCETANL